MFPDYPDEMIDVPRTVVIPCDRSRRKTLTTNQGVAVADNQNSLTAGQRGPILLQAIHLIEKMAHFDREWIRDGVCKRRRCLTRLEDKYPRSGRWDSP